MSKVHLLLDNVSPQGGQPFHQEMTRDAEAWIQQANSSGGGFQLEVLESRGDSKKQQEQIDQLGRELSPDSEDFIGISPTATGFVDFYLQSLFTVDGSTTRDKLTVCIFLEPLNSQALQQYGRNRLFSVTPNQELMGKMQGEVVHRVHPAAGNVLYMSGPVRSYQTKTRLRGARQFLEPKGYSILSALRSDWEGSDAEDIVASWSGRIETVAAAIAQNDSMAAGLKAGLERREVATSPSSASTERLRDGPWSTPESSWPRSSSRTESPLRWGSTLNSSRARSGCPTCRRTGTSNRSLPATLPSRG